MPPYNHRMLKKRAPFLSKWDMRTTCILCGHEDTLPEFLYAVIEGGCDTCSSPEWHARCPECHADSG